ncbi:MAG: HEAT repeat domain-containing protein [Bosea sp. (in: a-proteobacteria)]
MVEETQFETALLQVLRDKLSDDATGPFLEIINRLPLIDVAKAMQSHEIAGHEISQEILHAFRSRLKECAARTVFECLACVAMLPDAAEEREEATYWALVGRIHHETDSAAFERAAGWTQSEHPEMRQTGMYVLGQLGCASRAADWRHLFAEATQPILNRLLSDQNPYVVRAALSAAGHLNIGDISLIGQYASSPESSARSGVVDALLCRPEPAARELLIKLSTDEDTGIRDWATFGLGSQCEVDTPTIREALVARLDDSDADTRAEAIKGLANRHDPRVIPEILKEIERKDAGSIIFEAAATMPDPSYLPLLEMHRNSLPSDHYLTSFVQYAITACATGVAQPGF